MREAMYYVEAAAAFVGALILAMVVAGCSPHGNPPQPVPLFDSAPLFAAISDSRVQQADYARQILDAIDAARSPQVDVARELADLRATQAANSLRLEHIYATLEGIANMVQPVPVPQYEPDRCLDQQPDTQPDITPEPDPVSSNVPPILAGIVAANPDCILWFTEPWCGPCRQWERSTLPALSKVAKVIRFSGPDHRPYFEALQIKLIPTFLVIRDGQVVDQLEGGQVTTADLLGKQVD